LIEVTDEKIVFHWTQERKVPMNTSTFLKGGYVILEYIAETPTGQKRVSPNFPGGQPLGIGEEYVNLVESGPAMMTIISSAGNVFLNYQREIRGCCHRYSHKEDN
jgi:hypothetical protein